VDYTLYFFNTFLILLNVFKRKVTFVPENSLFERKLLIFLFKNMSLRSAIMSV